MKPSRSALLLLSVAFLACFVAVNLARAGGASLDEDDDQSNTGLTFFGFAKDLNDGEGIAGANVSADFRNLGATLITRTDNQGRFKFSGFATDIQIENVEITCSKESYKLQRTMRRELVSENVVIVEVDCLMNKP